MIASMTGFGRGEVKENGFTVIVEMRSLNHRFLDIELRLPKNLSALERDVKEVISQSLSRGRINATVTIKGDHAPSANLTIDKNLAETYLKLIHELKSEFKLNGKVKLEQLLSFPDIISFENAEAVDEGLSEVLLKAFEIALSDLKSMRQREGEEIKKDLSLRIGKINELIIAIEKHTELCAKEIFAKLKDRVAALAKTEQLNEGRLEMEVALLAEKADVTEECIRFKSHNTLFLELLEKGNSEGRKLNFLLQEMHREANTVGAKTNSAEISHSVVQIKEEVEKLREQIQNIE